jgi:Fe-S-cluster containining protein
MAANSDSIDKIVTTYFAALSKIPFTYKEKIITPKTLIISPLIFRGYTCPENCGACCQRVSLDYLPSQIPPPNTIPRLITLNNKPYLILSDEQLDHNNYHCRNLNKLGRCNIYEQRPFPCDFELIKFLQYKNKFLMIQKLYGRKHVLMRITKDKGTLCEMLPVNQKWKEEILRKLDLLKSWLTYFELDTHIDEIINYVSSGPHLYPLTLYPQES